MNIRFDSTFRWDPDAKWFDESSISHFVSGFMITLFFQAWFKNMYWSILVSNVLHIINDLLENSLIQDKCYGVEPLFVFIARCKKSTYLNSHDKDSIQNFLGDVISYLLGSFCVIYVYYKELKCNTKWSFGLSISFMLITIIVYIRIVCIS